ncbi:hypothetical protein DPEC_G00299460 [Dallia pectoralis]|uniref:Uncharacterized protein n=1 Tax=Dallia pectoralis TaxID=75939 RepID=A0ACC2FGB2_DALPE|nr:hypothetical protein DPEC_G00299460 [Dallia pectoralis]
MLSMLVNQKNKQRGNDGRRDLPRFNRPQPYIPDRRREVVPDDDDLAQFIVQSLFKLTVELRGPRYSVGEVRVWEM